MSSPTTPETNSTRRATPGAPPDTVPIPFLRRLLELTGVNRSPASIVTADTHFTGTTWQEVIESACDDRGMSTRRVIWSLREAIGAAQIATPLVSIRVDEQGRYEWFAITGQTRRRVLVSLASGANKWISIDTFPRWVGQETLDAPVSWIVVAARFPSAIRQLDDDDHDHHTESKPPFQRLVDLLRPDQADLWAFLLFASLIGGLTLATPIAVQQLVNSIAFGGLIQPVVVLALLLLVFLTFSAILSGVQAFVAELIQRRVFVRVVLDVAERLPRVRPEAFDTVHGPELVNRVFDIVTVQKVGSILLLEGTSVLLQTIVGLAVLSFYHPLMLGFSGMLVAGIVGVSLIGRGAVRTATAESRAKYKVVNWLEELARHKTTFRAAPQRAYARRRIDALAAGYVGARQVHYRIVLRQFGSALALQVVASSALLALGGMLVVQGQLTLGQLVASELIITVIVAAVAKFGKKLESFYDLLAAMEKLSRLVDLPLERDTGSDFDLEDGPAEIVLSGVDFSYGSTPVLADFDLRIAPGERIAVTGAMGSGKSALLDLLAGLREPSGGSISFNARDYRDIRLEELRESTALVREPEIFDGTVLENLQVGRNRFEHAEILSALEAVGLLEEIRMLPGGLDSPLATNGLPLSQVQIARLMLARAILAGPPLLLIDRALEHFDDEARSRICDVLFSPSAPWTLAIVTERADILERCTRTVHLGSPEIWKAPVTDPSETGGAGRKADAEAAKANR